MGSRSFNDMPDPSPILRPDRGAASSLALWFLCGLMALHLGILVWDRLPVMPPSPTLSLPTVPSQAAVAVPSASEPSRALISQLPPSPGSPAATPNAGLLDLPPPPSMPGGVGLPPSPPLPAPMRPPPAPPQARAEPPVPEPLPRSITGSPEVDEIISSAREAIGLNDPVATRAALESLQRADLLMPDQPTVLREMALAHQKLKETAKAAELFQRANAASGRTPSALPQSLGRPPAPSPAEAAPPGALDSAFAASASPPPPNAGPISFGHCKVARDMTCTTGERQILRVELRAIPGSVINPDSINIDVFFYDKVDGSRIEQSKGDKPVWKFDLPVDFKAGGVENVDITYHMPRMTEPEQREHGKRVYYGYVAKLYYDGKFMGEVADPHSLRTQQDSQPTGPQ